MVSSCGGFFIIILLISTRNSHVPFPIMEHQKRPWYGIENAGPALGQTQIFKPFNGIPTLPSPLGQIKIAFNKTGDLLKEV
jgi:hypothetical protein